MQLISNPTDVAGHLGWDPMTALLAPRIHVDGPRMMTPMILETDGGSPIVLARQQETGNIAAAGGGPPEVRFFDPYFTVESAASGSLVPGNLGELIASLGVGRLEVGLDLPYARFTELSSGLDVDLPNSVSDDVAVQAHRVSCADVELHFRTWRQQCCSTARAVIDDGRPALEGVKQMLGADVDTRFADLTASLEALNVDAVLIGSPVNLQELTGSSFPGGDWTALWPSNGDHVLLFGPDGERCPVEGSQRVGRFPRLAAAIESVIGAGRIGVEETWFSVGVVRVLEGAGLTPAPATRALARWREQRDVQDLGGSLVVAAASQYAIESAIAEASTRLHAGEPLTERDVAARYLAFADEFALRYRLPGTLAEFFTNCHAGNRTIYPSIPTAFPLTDQTRTLKVDAGLRWSMDGVTMATSDVGRTLTLSSQATEAYSLFTRIIRDDVTARLRPGVACPSPHTWCVDALDAAVPSLVNWQLIPPGVSIRDGYSRRNIGHLMGKQESFTTEFRPSNPFVLRTGDIGATEIQWPYAGHAIATEDMWVIGEGETYLISGA